MRPIKTAYILITLLLLSGCTTVAEIAGYDSRTMNEEAAKAYSQTIRSAQSQGIVETHSPTARRVHNVFRRMVPHAEAANQTGVPFAWEINVIRTDELNAFAMPGGKMVVNTGIIEQLQLSDDEIAAIVGHEMTHALLEHSKAEYGQKILTGIGMTIGGHVLQSQTGINPQYIGLGVGLAGDLGVSKPYSRSQEYEADQGGLILMTQAGYDPHAAISLWHKMRQAQERSGTPELFSTHPADESRIQALQALMPQVLQYRSTP